MSDLYELYQELILDHSKSPRNFRKPDGANREARGDNPLCGDKLHLYLVMEGDRIKDVGFYGDGCAISKASASLMTEAVKGKTRQEVEALYGRFHDLVTGKPPRPDGPELGKLEVFAGVSEFPVRVKCATLAWHAVKAAMEGADTSVSTE